MSSTPQKSNEKEVRAGAGEGCRGAIGHRQFNVGQLKIMQEVITLAVFVPFSVWYLREPIKLDYLWAGLCLCGAVYFVFRGGMGVGS